MAVSRLNGLILFQVKGNEESVALPLARKEMSSFLDRALTCSNLNAGEPDIPVSLRKANLVDASHNNIRSIRGLLDIAPSAWWINLKDNKLTDQASLHPLPQALGFLDITKNPVNLDVLHTLSSKHILRLKFLNGDSFKQNRSVLGVLPYVWVLNDVYYTTKERIEMENEMATSHLQNKINDIQYMSTLAAATAGSGKNGTAAIGNGNGSGTIVGRLSTDVNISVGGSLEGSSLVGTNTEGDVGLNPNPNNMYTLEDSVHLGSLQGELVNSIAEGYMVNEDDKSVPFVSDDGNTKTNNNNNNNNNGNDNGIKGNKNNSVISDDISLASDSISGNGHQHKYQKNNEDEYADYQPESMFHFHIPGNRESALLAAMHTFTPTSTYTIDYYRLDVLIEDYIEEASIANNVNIDIPYNGIIGTKYPTININILITLPRHIKMNLTILLSIIILYPNLPKILIEDIIKQMLHEYMNVKSALDILLLPIFAKTSINCLLKRIIYKEEEELLSYGTLIDKRILLRNMSSDLKNEFNNKKFKYISTCSGTSKGWKHMYLALEYLHTSINDMERILYETTGGKIITKVKGGPATTVASSGFSYDGTLSYDGNDGDDSIVSNMMNNDLLASTTNLYLGAGGSTASIDSTTTETILPYRFSSIEYQLLSIIPVIVTPNTPAFDKLHTITTQWVNIASRHFVLILAKSDFCPNLMKPQTSTKLQQTYYELMPLLSAAKMTMEDLVDVKLYSYGRLNNDQAISEKDWNELEAYHLEMTKSSIIIAQPESTTFLTATGNDENAKNEKNAKNVTMQKGKDFDENDENEQVLFSETNNFSNKTVKKVALSGGTALAFGVGLPRGHASQSLAWRVEQNEVDNSNNNNNNGLHDNSQIMNNRTYDVWNDFKQPNQKEIEKLRSFQYSQNILLKKQIEYTRRGRTYIEGQTDLYQNSSGQNTNLIHKLKKGGSNGNNCNLKNVVKSNTNMNGTSNQNVNMNMNMVPTNDLEDFSLHSLEINEVNEINDGVSITDSAIQNIVNNNNDNKNIIEGSCGGMRQTSLVVNMPHESSQELQEGSQGSISINAPTLLLTAEDAMNDEISSPLKGTEIVGVADPSQVGLPSVYQSSVLGLVAEAPPLVSIDPNKRFSPSKRPSSPIATAVFKNVQHDTRNLWVDGRQKKATMINGFSQNASKESNFLLAPTSSAIEHNRCASSPLKKLSMLHQAPILVHPLSPGLLTMPKYITGASTMVDQATIKKEFVRSIKEKGKGKEIERNGIYDDNVSQGSLDVSIDSATTSSSYTANPASATRKLLAEMGTLRNIRNLLIDDGAYKMPPNRLRPENSISEASNFMSNGNGNTSGNTNGKNPVFLGVNLDKTRRLIHSYSANNFSGSGSGNGNGNGNNGIDYVDDYRNSNFSNGNGNVDGTNNNRTNINQTKPLKIFKARQIDTILTSADLLKLKTNYSNIFSTQEIPITNGNTNNSKILNSSGNKGNGIQNGSGPGQLSGMRHSEQTVDGRPLSSNWYAVPQKATFIMSPERQDAVDEAMCQLYGQEYVPESTNDKLKQASIENAYKTGHKIHKNSNQVTYTQAKLRVNKNCSQSQSQRRSTNDPRASGVIVSSTGIQSRFNNSSSIAATATNKQQQDFTFDEGYSVGEYSNSKQSSYTQQQNQLDELEHVKNIPLNKLIAPEHKNNGFVNLGTHLQPKIKTNYIMSDVNHDGDDSSLDGTRENHQILYNKVKVNPSFKVKQQSREGKRTGIHLGMGSSVI